MVIHHSFNGAVTLSLQKFGTLFSCPLADHCFNGAVTLSLQKSVAGSTAQASIQWLQWSCNFIVTEISLHVLLSSSMVCKLQWSCNFIVTEILLGRVVVHWANIASMEL